MSDYAGLLARIAESSRSRPAPYPDARHGPVVPLGEAEIARAEEELGFRLHPLLAGIYRTVGDHGFGPGYGLFPLFGDGETVVGAYLRERRENAGTDWAWPEGVVPIATWGCGMYACVDCRDADGMVLLFEPNPGDPDHAWFVDAPSLATWWVQYFDGTGWVGFLEAEENGDEEAEAVELEPWRDARRRAMD